jgi:GNAT superfamily N-acetyltransferase
MPEVTIRPYEDSDLAEVLEVLRVSLGVTPTQSRSKEWFTWKHLDNPFGRSIMFVAMANGRLAGFRALLRWELRTRGGEILRCARPVDTATHPDFRRMGVFRELTECAIDAARADGIDLVFNTPNSRSGAGYRTMGWTEVGGIGVMVRPSPSLVSAPFRRHHSHDVRGLVQGEPATQAQGPVTADASGLHTPRTTAYLRWRYVDNPIARYVEIQTDGGTAILRPNVRNRFREVVISDVWGPDPVQPMRAAVRASRGDYLVGTFPKGSQARQAASRSGLLPVPGVNALTLVALPLHALGFEIADIDAWRLMMSDLELL